MNEMENLLPDPGISYSTGYCPGDCWSEFEHVHVKLEKSLCYGQVQCIAGYRCR